MLQIRGMWVSSGVWDTKSFAAHGVKILIDKVPLPPIAQKALPKPWFQFAADLLYSPVQEILKTYGYDPQLSPASVVQNNEQDPPRKIMLSHGTCNKYVPKEQTDQAYDFLTDKGYKVTKWTPGLPSDAHLKDCPYSFKKKYNCHVDEQYIDPKGYIERQGSFWRDVFGEDMLGKSGEDALGEK